MSIKQPMCVTSFAYNTLHALQSRVINNLHI